MTPPDSPLAETAKTLDVVRGVDVFRVRAGRVVEKLSYVKGVRAPQWLQAEQAVEARAP